MCDDLITSYKRSWGGRAICELLEILISTNIILHGDSFKFFYLLIMNFSLWIKPHWRRTNRNEVKSDLADLDNLDLGLGFGGKRWKIVRNVGFLMGKWIVRFGDETKGKIWYLGWCFWVVNSVLAVYGVFGAIWWMCCLWFRSLEFWGLKVTYQWVFARFQVAGNLRAEKKKK